MAARTLSTTSAGISIILWSVCACSVTCRRTSSSLSPRATKSQSAPTSLQLTVLGMKPPYGRKSSTGNPGCGDVGGMGWSIVLNESDNPQFGGPDCRYATGLADLRAQRLFRATSTAKTAITQSPGLSSFGNNHSDTATARKA